MKSRKRFLIYLSTFSLIIILALAFFVSENKKEESELFEDVDYTFNILRNGNFESRELAPWSLDFKTSNSMFVFIDEIIKFEGNQSLNITSDNDGEILTISQIVKHFPTNKKLILNGKVRTEDVQATYLSIQLFSKKDSLIAEALSDTLVGTNDWTHLTTWVRTINPDLAYLKIKCNLVGKGRAWFDNLELFPVEIEQKTIIPIRK
jgi:hypothetical protein